MADEREERDETPAAPWHMARRHGAPWVELWDRAHRAMAPHGFAPHEHLVTRMLQKQRSRGWICDHFTTLAEFARYVPPEWEQDDPNRTCGWFVHLGTTATLVRVRLLVHMRTERVFSAYPDPHGTPPRS